MSVKYFLMMMKKISFLFLLCLAGLFPFGNAMAEGTDVSRPRLVVGIVVDQMRWDYLYRYHDRYGEGGFRRLMREGFSCENLMIDYLPTITAVGHTSVFTGTVPSIHGITGNSFTLRSTGEKVNCVGDSREHTVGSDSHLGERSPRRMLATTVTDELRLATNFRAKTVGVALKDRAAILPAGHTANAAYWFDSKTGRWVTSTYYMKQLPAWLEAYNRTDPARRLLSGGWQTLLPAGQYTQSTADDMSYELPIAKGVRPVFPYDTAGLLEQEGYGVVANTPFGNTLTKDMAKLVIEHEQLGQDGDTDFLTMSFSSTDALGHLLGVNAVEIEDTYVRLDKDLADFFDYLDAKVGRGLYTVFLTADHGGPHHARFLRSHGIPSGEWEAKAVVVSLDSVVHARFGIDHAVLGMESYQVLLDREKLGAATFTSVKKALSDYLRTREEVAYVVDFEDAASLSVVPQAIRERIVNGYHPNRSGDLQIILSPGWYDASFGRVNHGVWCTYDSHLPLLFMGWGVKPGRTCAEVHMTDIAATVAALLRIQMPSGCIGKPIVNLLH